MKKATLSVVLFVCATLFAGCSGGSGSMSPVAPTRTVVAISVIGPNQLQIGEPRNFSARAKWSDGAEEDVTNQASWNAIPAGVASTTAGVVRAAQPGSLQITAVYSGVSGVMQVEVMSTAQPVPVASGFVTVESVSPLSGTTLTYTPNAVPGVAPSNEIKTPVSYDFTSTVDVYLTVFLADDNNGHVIWHSRSQLNLGRGASRKGTVTMTPSIYLSGGQGITRTTKVVAFLTTGVSVFWDPASSSPYLAEAQISNMVTRAEKPWTFNWR